MKPPENFKGLVKKINNNFKIVFEERSEMLLDNFDVGTYDSTYRQFLGDERGFTTFSYQSQHGIYLRDYENGFEFKNVCNPKDAIVFFKMVSLYFNMLEYIPNK